MARKLEAKGKRSVVVGRDVINSIINTGDHNRFFVGDYERLCDAYLEPWSVFERVDLKHFTGREWLAELIDTFLRDHDRGYFILEAEAGLGKTAFLAWLVSRRGYIHHFSELAPGDTGRGLKNLAAQLVLAYHLSAYEAEGVLPGAAARPDFLSKLLQQVVQRTRGKEKVVLVLDALDEAGTPSGQNVLGLPEVLPEGVFVIVSQRPVPVALRVDTATTPREVCPLLREGDQNRDDVRRYLESATAWPGIFRILRQTNQTSSEFTASLLKKSEYLWIYLHYVLPEIEKSESTSLDLDALPNGLTQYYGRYWQKWRDSDAEQWYETYLPLLAVLAATTEAITAERLVAWSAVTLRPERIQRLLYEQWRPFLATEGERNCARYRLYHATLREFLGGQVSSEKLTGSERALAEELSNATRSAHDHLSERYVSAWGGFLEGLPCLREMEKRQLDDGYGLRHLIYHLAGAGRAGDIHRLLAMETGQHRNLWYEVKVGSDGTAAYLADVLRAWRLAEVPSGIPDSAPTTTNISLQNRYALITASIRSLAANIPPDLLIALVKRRVRPVTQGLAYAREIPDFKQKANALTALAPYLPEPERTEVLREALGLTREITNYWSRVCALAALARHLPEPERTEVLRETLGLTREITNYGPDADDVLAALAPHLPESLVPDALGAAREIKFPPSRLHALTALAPYLPEPERTEVLREALGLARKIENKVDRVHALTALAPYLPEPEQTEVLREALGMVRKIEDGGDRADALKALAPYLPEPFLPEALGLTRKIEDKESRVHALAALAPHLPEPLLPEALAVALQVDDPSGFVHALTALAPHLPEPLMPKALGLARKIEDGGYRADALTALAALLMKLPNAILTTLWQQALPALADRTRGDLLLDLSALTPVMLSLVGTDVVLQTCRAIRDVGWWWP
jgi:hypothetical protein